MLHLCERTGCSEPGAFAYGMIPIDLVFWLAPLDDARAAANNVLCRMHADAIVVPRGWRFDDRRSPTWPPPTRGSAAPAPDTPSAGPDGTPARADDAPAQAGAPTPTVGSMPPPSAGEMVALWQPACDGGDALRGFPDPRTPQLIQASRGADGQRD